MTQIILTHWGKRRRAYRAAIETAPGPEADLQAALALFYADGWLHPEDSESVLLDASDAALRGLDRAGVPYEVAA